MNGPEETIASVVQYLKLAVETTGAAMVALGAAIAIVLFVRALLMGRADDFNAIRLVLARYLALALEFQLGADILSTAIAPSLEEIGKLGAIAVIRTGLNYFLSLEMQSERSAEGASRRVQARAEGKSDPARYTHSQDG
jgi:uncharacterized membrane protein